MAIFSTPPGYKPADSISTAALAGIAVFTVYGGKIGPVADVHATAPGDPNVNAAVKKAGWTSLALVAVLTFLTRDLNVLIVGAGSVVLEHTMYLHAEMSNPANGQITVNQAAYAPAVGLAAVGAAVGT